MLPFELDQATQTAKLLSPTRDSGLSLGDRACLVAAKSQDASALTSDRTWKGLQHTTGVKIELIR